MAITYTDRIREVLLHKHNEDYIRSVTLVVYGEQDGVIHSQETVVFLDAKPSSGFIPYSDLAAADKEATVIGWAKAKISDDVYNKLKERIKRFFDGWETEADRPSSWAALPDE